MRSPHPQCTACAAPLELRRAAREQADAGPWQGVLDGPFEHCCVNPDCENYLKPRYREPGS